MEAIVACLHENSELIPEGLYLTLMNLSLVVYNLHSRPVILANPPFRMTLQDRRLTDLKFSYNITRTLTITDDEWTQLQPLVNSFVYPNGVFYFVNKLKELHNIDPWENTQYIFPSHLSTEARQILHIMGKQGHFATLTTKNNTNEFNLNLFIR